MLLHYLLCINSIFDWNDYMDKDGILNIDELLNIAPYELDYKSKTEYLNTPLIELTKYHYDHCLKYKRIIDSVIDGDLEFESYADIPFLPVRLFKEYDLKSIEEENVVKTMTSSGTTSQVRSRIYLDKETSRNQTKVLTSIVSDFLGKKRLPMIVLDTSAVIKDRKLFTARGAGILGFSIFARERFFAFDEKFNLFTFTFWKLVWIS